MKKVCTKLTKFIWLFLAFIIISTAILFGLMRAATPYLSQYKSEIISKINASLPVNITIDNFSIAWYHFSPVISLNNVNVYKNDLSKQLIAKIHTAYIGINLLTLIKTHQAIPDKLIVDQANIRVPFSLLKNLRNDNHQASISPDKIKLLTQTLYSFDKLAFKKVQINFIQAGQSALTLTGDLLLTQKAKSFRLQGSINNPNNDAGLNFISNIMPNIEHYQDTNIKSYVEFNNIDTYRLAPYLKINFPINANSLTGKTWLNLQQQKVIYGAAVVRAKNTRINLNAISTKKDIPFLAFTVLYKDDNKTKSLALNNLTFSPNKKGGDLRIDLNGDTTSSNISFILNDFKFNTENFLEKFNIHLNNKETKNILFNTKPQFDLNHALGMINIKNKQISTYHLQLALTHLTLHNYNKIPGLTNLAINANINNHLGSASINLQSSALSIPWLFRKTNIVKSGAGIIHWKLQNQRIELKTSGKLIMPEGEIYPSMQLTVGGGQTVQMALLADVNTTGLTNKNVYAYLPVGIMPDEVATWLDGAIQKVGSSKAKLILRSDDMSTFPFDKNQGIFLINADTQHAQLHFYKNWPSVTDISANLIFRNRAMQIIVAQAKTAGIQINNAKAIIPEMGGSHGTQLKISANGAGQLNQGLNYLIDSPIANDIQMLKSIHASGKFNALVHLEIPISDLDNQIPQVDGVAQIKDGRLEYMSQPLTLNHINGALHFKNAAISTNLIDAYLGDKPVKIDVKPMNNKSASTKINVTGKYSIADLNKYFPSKIPNYISGAATILTSLTFDSKQGMTVALSSDLKGININLPKPLGKSINEASTFTLIINNITDQIKQILLSYQKKLFVNMFINSAQNKFAFIKGTVNVGQKTKIKMPSKGLNLTAKFPAADLQPWYAWYIKNIAKQTNTNFSGILNSATLQVDKLNLLGQSLTNFSVRYTPYTNYLLFNIISNNIIGNINIPKQVSVNKPIVAKFKKFYLKASTQSSPNKQQQIKLNNYYNVNFNLADFRYNQIKFGALSGKMRTTNSNGLIINPLNAQSANYKLISQIAWNNINNMTRFKGQLTSTNTAKFLAGLGLSGQVYSKNANAKFDLQWRGFPTDFKLSNLNGNYNFNVQNGKISGLSRSTNAKLGLGTIITSLNIESLPQRITNGFRDKGKGGLNFKKMEGNFTIKNGNLLTQRAYLESTVAYISLKGRIGLVAKDLNLMMSVVPHLTASLPVIATIAGGPIVGAATWVLDKAISPEVNKISQYNYAITGSWKKPIVTKK